MTTFGKQYQRSRYLSTDTEYDNNQGQKRCWFITESAIAISIY
ncbi:hypothetical protein [Pseudanabaena sp. SR411]|nr:hypothetical protein [Pseudanabaena sp. SR411]